MPDILLEVPVSASPERVYEAITKQQGLSNWWTPDVSGDAEVGHSVQFRFPGGYAVGMETVALEPGRRLQWIVREGSPDWIGTDVTWDLTRVGDRTRVRFAQRNFSSTEGSFPYAAWNWAWYLTSLKAYLETGKGKPGQLPV